MPAELKVIEIYSINYACPDCAEQDLPVIKKEKTDGRICFMATMTNWVIGNSEE